MVAAPHSVQYHSGQSAPWPSRHGGCSNSVVRAQLRQAKLANVMVHSSITSLLPER